MNRRPAPDEPFEGGPERAVPGVVDDDRPPPMDGPMPPHGAATGPFGPPPPFGAGPQSPFHRPAQPGQPGLHVVGGAQGPAARAEVIAFVRLCHRGQQNRTTRTVDPWRCLVLVHLDSGRTVGQWDVRPDEDDLELAHEIDSAANTHGVPLARRNGTQVYQIDAYFGGETTPRANQIVEVDAPAALHGATNALAGRMGPNGMAAARTMSPQDYQVFRHNEAIMQMGIGMAQFNLQSLQDQLAAANAEVHYYRGQIAEIEDRERKLKDAENSFKLQMFKEQRSAARKDWMIAKLVNYAPVFLAKLDQRLSGMLSLTGDEKEQRALGMFKKLLGKLQDNNGGPEKLATVATTLGLDDNDLAEIMDFGKILWLEDQRQALQREAEKIGRGGGFADLGKDVAAINQRLVEKSKLPVAEKSDKEPQKG